MWILQIKLKSSNTIFKNILANKYNMIYGL